MSLIQKTDQYGRPDYTEVWDWNVPEIPTFPETADGRRRKGELEILVDYIIKEWLVGESDDETFSPLMSIADCTAEHIARRAAELDGRSTSSDAVWRCLKRMQEIGYVDISDDKPHRFICLTADGLKKGLRQLNEENKRLKKRAKREDDVRAFNKAAVKNKIKRMR
ncbi:helix-turn-helix DNA binding protein [Gordonia phage RobinSparkles]|nr:helix-turn-helix DNA binding protein [Gordonia phage RobinSparkles]